MPANAPFLAKFTRPTSGGAAKPTPTSEKRTLITKVARETTDDS